MSRRSSSALLSIAPLGIWHTPAQLVDPTWANLAIVAAYVPQTVGLSILLTWLILHTRGSRRSPRRRRIRHRDRGHDIDGAAAPRNLASRDRAGVNPVASNQK